METADVLASAIPQIKKVSTIIWIILVLVAVFIIFYFGLIRKVADAVTPKNKEEIASNAVTQYTPFVDRMEQNRRDYMDSLKLPANEMALANFHVLGCRLTGFLGPDALYGVFWEKDATSMALKAGARVLVMDIDYLSDNPTMPVLVCRAANGNHLSLNKGAIRPVADAIFDYRKRSSSVDPIILYLNIIRVPGEYGSSDSLKYMSKIAEELKPIHRYIIRQTERGVYTQQGMQDTLFLQPITEFEGKMLIFTNADTSAYRSPPPTFKVDAATNLDNIVNARFYEHITKDEDRRVKPAAYVDTPDFYRNLPTDETTQRRYKDEARRAWVLARAIGADDRHVDRPMYGEMMNIVRDIGVQCIAVNIFKNLESADPTNPIFGANGGLFRTHSYVPKKEELRYKEPAPVTLAAPSQKLNAGGGVIQMPSVAK
jgi:hypothetical protein